MASRRLIRPRLTAADYQYLYKDGTDFVFMDTDTSTSSPFRGPPSATPPNFMLENQSAMIAMHDGNPLYVELPASVVLEITYTEPGLQGDRSTGGTKPATLETGYEIQVPAVPRGPAPRSRSTPATGGYLGRVND